ncbi:E3 ubiquitin-protein ligase synoviolin [Nematocida displodere]|uniref:E3 ubiquitin-protein ligase synoviolin n=1 Tax=Nematocida displodere TaxID=1805483 RepID=A0A177ED60_9MICR|nr:E3 ubiquitin-protein ligase synoviolin [Nematocida displodere]
MLRDSLYALGYLALLTSICMKHYLAGETFYHTMVNVVDSRIEHFVLCSLLVFFVYLLGKATISAFVGKLTPLEREGVHENGIRYLGNVCLIITLFADDISLKGLVGFSVILALKVVHWVVGLRIETIERSGGFGTSIRRLVSLCGILTVLNFGLMVKTLGFAVAAPGLAILFAFEFSVLFAYSLRCLYMLRVVSQNIEAIEDRIFAMFYGDLAFGISKLVSHVICLVWTTMYFRMPINLLREAIMILKNLTVKTRSVMAYKTLIKDLEKCQSVPNAEMQGDKTCLICHEEMDVGKLLECLHLFHLGCLKEWLHRQQACPVCRKEVLVKTPPAEQGGEGDSRIYFRSGSHVYEGVPVPAEEEPPVNITT